MAKGFSATIGAWAARAPEAIEAVIKGSMQDLVIQLTSELTTLVYEKPESETYKRTGFLRASLVGSTSEMPRLTEENPGTPTDATPTSPIIAINALGEDGTLYLGYTAKYGAYVHWGARGMPPRPWVQIVAARWDQIVSERAASVKRRFGL